jgi:hypothetical protein
MQRGYVDADTIESAANHTLNREEIRTRCGQLHLRNYDESRQYRLTVSVRQPNGGPKYEATYELAPSDVASELEIVPPGRYEVHVSGSFRPVDGESHHTAGRDEETANCNVGDRPPQTVVVECGNGIVTVSEGLSG